MNGYQITDNVTGGFGEFLTNRSGYVGAVFLVVCMIILLVLALMRMLETEKVNLSSSALSWLPHGGASTASMIWSGIGLAASVLGLGSMFLVWRRKKD